ncbi:MAG TPA: parallel beta-helix domain-containing protein [Flavisolibacter sp.]|nr:parallel beta-helix domain-containing protein [Flavisolibacter sp.]
MKSYFISQRLRNIHVIIYSGIMIFLILFMAGCKKEITNTAKELNTTAQDLNGAEQRIDVVVHSGNSIQTAIDAARPGSVISIQPGVYKEAIIINKKGIFLIGAGEGVIIQNPGGKNNGITVMDNANGFVLKNLTVKDFGENGVYLSHVNGFLISKVTTINNGEYGIFPVYCENGIIDHCSATGHKDTGIYVGQSKNVLVLSNTAFANVNGIEVENCTNVSVNKNESFDNSGGLLVILLPGLTVKSADHILLTDNYIHDNNHENFSIPSGGFEVVVPKGSGVLIVGVDHVTMRNNKIVNNQFVGIAVVSTLVLGGLSGLPPSAFADIEPNADYAHITGNQVANNGSAPPAGLPLPGVDLLWDGTGINNCWENNSFSTSYPSQLPSCR